MRIAAALVWYDEPLDSLERCLRSLAPVADVLVAVDGRWNHFVDDRPVTSPREQRELVLELSTLFGECELELGEEDEFAAWESQVDKRSYTYGRASTLADWTLVIDADEYVEEHDRHGLRHELATTDRLTARIGSRTIRGPSANAGIVLQPRLFSSAGGELRVESSHNGVRNAAGDWLAGDPAYVELVPHVDVGDHLRLFHEQGARRPRWRELADRAYRRARLEHRVEGWPQRIPRHLRK